MNHNMIINRWLLWIRNGISFKNVFLFFVFLTLFYPYLYNAVLYGINYLFYLFGKQLSPYVNLILIGWKDVAIILAALTLFFLNRNYKIFGGALLLFFAMYLFLGQLSIKEIYEAFLILLVYILYREKFLLFLLKHHKPVWWLLLIIITGLLLIGYADYFYRIIHQITSDTWAHYYYLLNNNVYRCSKVRFNAAALPGEYHQCVYTWLNFYKLGISNGRYSILQTLFLPVGDSVVFSFFLLFIFMAYLTDFGLQKRVLKKADMLIIIALAVSIFLTLCRMSAIFAVIFTFLFAICYFSRINNLRYFFTIFVVLAAYLLNIQYLLFSMLSLQTPSNIKHINFLPKLMQQAVFFQYNYVVLILIGLIAIIACVWIIWLFQEIPSKNRVYLFYSSLLLLSIVLYFKLRYYNHQDSNVPLESNYLKVLYYYGLFGMAIYLYIISFILNESLTAFQLAMKYIRITSVCFPGIILSSMGFYVFLYQFFSPYVISGYAMFSAFISIWMIYLTYFKHITKNRDFSIGKIE